MSFIYDTNFLYQSFWILHILGGAAGLITFWLPVAFRKGSPRHKQTGTWFVWGMTAAGLTGLAMSSWWLYEPMLRLAREVQPLAHPERAYLQVRLAGGFLGVLSLLLLANLRHGVLVLRAKQDRALLRRPAHLALQGSMALASLVAVLVGWRYQHTLMQVFGGIGLFSAFNTLRYCFKAQLSSREWWIEHLSMLITCGIAAHSAFFVFGASRVIGQLFTGSWQLVPWLAPTVIGVPAIILASRHYRRKFGAASTPAVVKSVALPQEI
ncbi:MAG: hypothetical protein HYV16_14670 [Gammaproteobacteria bacterium]|nr:hypothetical protein [Gammaproteobacteria bacterium]